MFFTQSQILQIKKIECEYPIGCSWTLAIGEKLFINIKFENVQYLSHI